MREGRIKSPCVLLECAMRAEYLQRWVARQSLGEATCHPNVQSLISLKTDGSRFNNFQYNSANT